jgi:hypothetical protein
MIEIIILVTIMLAIGLFLVFRYLCSFKDDYYRTTKDILEIQELVMNKIKTLNKEIEQLKKEK